MLNYIPLVKRNMVWKKRNYGSVFYAYATQDKVKINTSGTMLVEVCDGKSTIGEIIRRMAQVWEISPEEIREDLCGFYQSMVEQQVMTFDHEDGIPACTEEYEPPLDSTTIQITNKCNLRCPHCFVSSGEAYAEEMTTAEIKRVLDDLHRLKVFEVTFTGGEPLIREDFFELAQYANDQKIAVCLFTNGLLCTDEIIEKLTRLKLTNIQVSVDGITAEIHDQIRGKGTFDQVITNIKKMVAAGLNVHLAATINRLNYQWHKDFINLAIDLGVNAVNASEVFLLGRAEKNADTLALTADQVADLRVFYGLESIFNKQIKVGSGFDIDSVIQPFAKEDEEVQRANLTMCRAGRETCTILPDGRIVTCQSFTHPDYIAGDVRRDSFLDLWQNSPVFQHMRELSVDQFKVCKDCEYKYLCAGGCRAVVFHQTGDIYGKPDSHTCYWKKKFYQQLDIEMQQRYNLKFSDQWQMEKS